MITRVKSNMLTLLSIYEKNHILDLINQCVNNGLIIMVTLSEKMYGEDCCIVDNVEKTAYFMCK